jgi:hypothetical protein
MKQTDAYYTTRVEHAAALQALGYPIIGSHIVDEQEASTLKAGGESCARSGGVVFHINRKLPGFDRTLLVLGAGEFEVNMHSYWIAVSECFDIINAIKRGR